MHPIPKSSFVKLMAPIFTLVKDLDRSRTNIMMKLRLIRNYEVPSFGNHQNIFSSECVFHDYEGNRVHAHIKKSFIRKIEPMLHEGQLYILKDFVVDENTLKFKTTASKFKINFITKTKISEVFDDEFPDFVFSFKPFNEIESIDEAQLFDVMGKVVSRCSIQTKDLGGRATKLIDIVLEDIDNVRLPCTLWGTYAEDVVSLLDNETTEPIIVVLQFCRAKTYKGVVGVSNLYNVTKMMVSPDIIEVTQLKKGLIEGTNSHPKNDLNQASSSRIIINNDVTSGGGKIIPIKQLLEIETSGTFWVFGRIVSIEALGAWAYLSCNTCSSKVDEIGGKFICSKCSLDEVSGHLRFKLTVVVEDDTGHLSLLLWNKECLQLLGKTASEISQASEADLDEIPPELEKLVDRSAIFKIQVKLALPEANRESKYNVLSLTCDERVMANFPGFRDITKKMDYPDDSVVSTISDGEPKLITIDDLSEEECLKRNADNQISSDQGLKKKKLKIKEEKEE